MRSLINLVENLSEDAWHGSPHIFNKFSTSQIGKGEGNQVFGWGLYFAGAREVAQFYRDVLTSRHLNASRKGDTCHAQDAYEVNGRVISIGDPDYAAAKTAEWAQRYGVDDERLREQVFLTGNDWRTGIFEKIAEFMKYPVKRVSPDNGSLYHVQIPDEGSYLLWDEPYPKQPQMVKNALETLMNPSELTSQITGQVIYLLLAHDLGGKEKASRALFHAGISGNKYLDSDSRDIGSGSYNYVIFDDSLVDIKARS